ncbi:uncharacterized protein [Nicotiana sylvestris]|uniref:uncharacterized protein n=1 Tax=Nicotiana sylvestris TaxID=4096 RepID=UPI00388C5E0B
MTGIPPEVMTHKLNEDPSYPLVKQKKRKQGTFKNQDHFEWNEECQQVLRNLKMYLSNPPLLAKPKAEEKLLIYLACHPIAVVTAYPLRNILHKHELSGRLAMWAIELSEYEITYQPRTAIKSQVLADFVVDFSQGMKLEAEKELQVFNGANLGTWTLFTDGSSDVKGVGLGIILVPPMGETIRQAIKFNQMLGTYTAREARMQQYLEKVRDLTKQFQNWKVTQTPRDENVEADALANLVSAANMASDANASVIHLFHSVLDPDKNEINFNNLMWD